MSSSPPDLLDHGARTDDQDAAQGLVTGARDHAEPGLASGRVILRRQPDPSREIPARSENMRIGDLHRQQRGPDRADGGDLHQPTAQFVVLVPGHQPGFDRRNLQLELGVFLAVRSEQVLRKPRQRRISRDARQQRLDLVEPLGGDQSELGGVTADRVAQLRSATNQPVRSSPAQTASSAGSWLRRSPPHRPHRSCLA